MNISSTVAVVLLGVSARLFAQDAIAPGDNLIADGIPPIPSSLAESAQRYSGFREADFSDWNSTKREMQVVTRSGDTLQVHKVAAPGAAPQQLTFFPDNVYGWTLRFQPVKGRSFIFGKDSGGNELYQYYRYDLATGKSTLLTDGLSRNVGLIWSHSGDRIAYSSTRRNGKDADIWIADPYNPKSARMLTQAEGGGWFCTDWSNDGRKILLRNQKSSTDYDLWVVDVATGRRTLVTPKPSGESIFYSPAKFSKDGKGIWVSTDKDSEFERLAYIDLHTMQHRFLTSNIHWDVEDFDLSPDGALIAVITNEAGLSVLHLLGTSTGSERSAPKLPIGVVSRLRFDSNGQSLGLTLSTSKQPNEAYSVDVRTGSVVRWTFNDTVGVDASSFPEPELIQWKSFDERTVSGFLYRPPSRFKGPRPVIIEAHGGPQSQSRPEFLGPENYFLNELGVAMIFPNIRGSTGYGKSFANLDRGMLRDGGYKDIGALLKWIQSQPSLDSKRVMLTGVSYGGHVTLAAAEMYNDLVRCSVDNAGISNLVTFLQTTAPFRRDKSRAQFGDERDPQMHAYLESIAPVNNAHKITKPLMVIAGLNDPRVPHTEAEQMVTAVRNNGTQVWFLTAKDEGHVFEKKSNVDFEFYSTILFIKSFLLN